jgi:hypothetical protein
VGHLNELQAEYREQGLAIVCVSKQAPSAIETFIEELQPEYPIVAEASDSMRAYGRSSYPSAFLIGPDGRVVWDGHPASLDNGTIETALESVRVLPAFPDVLGRAARYFEDLKYGKALKAVEAELARERLEGDDLSAAEAIRDWFHWYAASNLEDAARQMEEGAFYEASLTYERIEDLFDGHDFETQAKDALKDLLDDADRKREVKAGERLARILAAIAEEDADPEEALRMLRPVLGRKYEDTRAGREAAAMAEELRARLED